MRSWDERWQPGNYEKNVEAIRELTQLAEAKGTGVTQLALAWLLAQGDDIVPIPGPANRRDWPRTWPPPTCASPTTTSRGSTKSTRTARSEAPLSRGDDAAVVKRRRGGQSLVTRV
jgi:hypothetical protein